MIWYKINRWLQKRSLKKYKPHQYKQPDRALYDAIKQHGEGIYGMHLKSANNNIVAKLIGLFSGGWSHSLLFLYREGMFYTLPPYLCSKVYRCWCFWYGDAADFQEPELLVLGSADEWGLMCHELSHYQYRKFIITKITTDPAKTDRILQYIDSRLMVDGHIRPYDATGLALWLLKFGDDPRSDYCSEIYYDACHYAGIQTAHGKDPRPVDLVNYAIRTGTVIYIKNS